MSNLEFHKWPDFLGNEAASQLQGLPMELSSGHHSYQQQMFNHSSLQLPKTVTDICEQYVKCGQLASSGSTVQTRASSVYELTTASPAARNNSRGKVMYVGYSSDNLVNQGLGGV